MTTPGHEPAQSPPRDELEAIARLRAHGGRLTPSRRELVRHFFDHDTTITVDELVALFPFFDPATLYRTVNVLERTGIIEHIHLGHGAATYRRAGADTVTVVCRHCGGAIEVARRDFRTLATKIHDRHGFTIDLGHFAITGTCAECADRSSARWGVDAV